MPAWHRYPQGMQPRFSARALSLTPFLAMEVMERAFELEAEGAWVLHLEVGEAGAVAAPPVIISAILDALAPLGVPNIDMPATPERIWRAIQDAQ